MNISLKFGLNHEYIMRKNSMQVLDISSEAVEAFAEPVPEVLKEAAAGGLNTWRPWTTEECAKAAGESISLSISGSMSDDGCDIHA